MNSLKTGTLRVSGANLFYEVRGKGPHLLLIHGGGSDNRSFNQLTTYLADRYTIITYDRRGLSQSTLDNPDEEQQVSTHSDDAYHLLNQLNTGPAHVFGSSAGAVVALDLVARYPEQIQTLIAHEPPMHLQPESDPILELGAIREMYLREGFTSTLFQKLMSQDGLDQPEQELHTRLPDEYKKQLIKNMVFLFEHEFTMIDHYQFDFTALKHASTLTRIVLAGGTESQDRTYQSASAIANQLKMTLVEFPGRHVGYLTHPELFAQRLHTVLQAYNHPSETRTRRS